MPSAGAARPLNTGEGGRKTRQTVHKRAFSEKQAADKGAVNDNPAAAARRKCGAELVGAESSQAAVLELFSGLHGCGPKTAQKWYHEYGYRTLDDLRTSDKLTHNQKVGVRFYDDLRQNMPREEAAAIGAYVERAAKLFNSGYQCHIMGSYRRGKPFCGDVDVIGTTFCSENETITPPTFSVSTVTHPDGRSHDGLVAKLLAELERVPGLLVEHLQCRSAASGYEDSEQYMGICRLPGGPGIHRRLDIWAVPWDEIGAALVHWTGNTIL
ncbi:hypothetical protein HDU87_007551 [Geranomyces variabilis]|uniref:DNA polymerase n=1 Tax=Geranomyces variabilis TaxID=109894 RepID=A0AAD5TPJ6_9FUNG|nr:hypothetical protein HDU87_007551 [Geranomyces variabilis]